MRKRSLKKPLIYYQRMVDRLIDIFRNNYRHFFFNEKEMHAYLYHLFVDKQTFLSKNGLNLLHTEYPTPFKCIMGESYSEFQVAPDDSNHKRGHIDIVLINPNFISWIFENKRKFKPIDYIKGLTNKPFCEYIQEMKNVYGEFNCKIKEPILLSALEFKFFRRTEGITAPINLVSQDIQKLLQLETIKVGAEQEIIPFAQERRLIVFITENVKSLETEIISNEFIKKNSHLLTVVSHDLAND